MNQSLTCDNVLTLIFNTYTHPEKEKNKLIDRYSSIISNADKAKLKKLNFGLWTSNGAGKLRYPVNSKCGQNFISID